MFQQDRSASDVKFIRLPQVKEMTGYSRATLYRRMAEGKFPKARKDGSIVYWTDVEVKDWQAKKLAQGG